MKTTVLFRMIVLVAMVFAGIANTTVKAQGNNFITNEEKVDELVVSKVIYRLDGSLYRHMKYDFTYDDQKRMSSKEAFKWDASTEKWIPYFKIDYTLKSATKLFSVLLASKRPLITELADKLRLKYPLLPTISPCPTMRLEAIRSIIPISCRRYPKSV